jgi:hypothetical protein
MTPGAGQVAPARTRKQRTSTRNLGKLCNIGWAAAVLVATTIGLFSAANGLVSRRLASRVLSQAGKNAARLASVWSRRVVADHNHFINWALNVNARSQVGLPTAMIQIALDRLTLKSVIAPFSFLGLRRR